jgi:hypothetical protein
VLEAVAVRLDVGLVLVGRHAVLAVVAGAMPRAVRLDVGLVLVGRHAVLAVVAGAMPRAMGLDVGFLLIVTAKTMVLKLSGHGSSCSSVDHENLPS